MLKINLYKDYRTPQIIIYHIRKFISEPSISIATIVNKRFSFPINNLYSNGHIYSDIILKKGNSILCNYCKKLSWIDEIYQKVNHQDLNMKDDGGNVNNR